LPLLLEREESPDERAAGALPESLDLEGALLTAGAGADRLRLVELPELLPLGAGWLELLSRLGATRLRSAGADEPERLRSALPLFALLPLGLILAEPLVPLLRERSTGTYTGSLLEALERLTLPAELLEVETRLRPADGVSPCETAPGLLRLLIELTAG